MVIIYSTSWCPSCVSAKRLLESKNVEYQEINIEEVNISREKLVEIAGAVLGHEQPRVGLLNIGEEEKKGPEVIQEAHQLLKQTDLNFVGNIEGGDFLQGKAQVVVTPGYAGNIVLKLMEGFAGVATKTFGKVDTPDSKKFFEEWDYDNYGGAFLLGLNGTGIIAHGRANSKAIAQAVRTAYDFARSEVSTKIAKKLAKA